MKRYYDNSSREVLLFPVIRDIVVIVALLIVCLIFWPFQSIPTGSRGVLTQFGKIIKIEDEGLVTVMPWQRVNLFSIRAESANIDDAPGATLDTQPVDTSLTVRYNIRPEKVAEVYEQYSHNGDLGSYVQTASMEVFKAVTAKYTAPDLIAKRQQASLDIYAALQNKLDIYGAHVINIDMRNFKFSDTYMHAINEKVTQEQLALAAVNQVKTIEAQQQAKVVTATAEANAVKAKADGDAYAVIKAANAQAEALSVQNDALVKSKEVLELRRIEVELTKAQKWDGVLPVNIYGSAPIPFLNVGK